MLPFSWFVPLKSGVFWLVQHSKEHCKGGISTHGYAIVKEDYKIQYWILLAAVFLNSKLHWGGGEGLEIYTVLWQGWCFQMLIYKASHQKSEQPVASGEIWEKETNYCILVKRRASYGEDRGSKWCINGFNLIRNLTAILLPGTVLQKELWKPNSFVWRYVLCLCTHWDYVTTKREGSKLSNIFIALASQRAGSWGVTALFWMRPRLRRRWWYNHLTSLSQFLIVSQNSTGFLAARGRG